MAIKENLKEIFEEHIQLVEPAIEELLLKNVDSRHHDAVMFYIKGGGKRIRPVLTFLVCRMMGGDIKEALYPAAGLEIMHNYTLIVDDQMDSSEFRHGEPTLWKALGPAISDCIAVYYACAIFEGANRGKNSSQLVELFATTLKLLDNGQLLDVLYEVGGREDEPYVLQNRFTNLTVENYLEMIGGKTASLYSGCCQTGGICSSASDGNLDLLKEFGYNLGLAFQIRDDLLDIFGDEKKFGKEIGKDIKERKASNIVILLTINSLEVEGKEVFKSIFNKEKITNNDVKIAMDLIGKTDARGKAEELAEEYIGKSKESLAKLPQNEWTEILSDLADFIVSREK